LFLELASRADGVSGMEAHGVGGARGDNVTVEAYHNLGRRLASRGLVRPEQKDRATRYFTVADGQWLDEDELARIVNPDYPLIALTAAKRMQQELRTLPDEVWIAAREVLKGDNARALFLDAIMGYADFLRDELQHIRLEEVPGKTDSNLRHGAEDIILVLQGLAKFGLGLSREAIRVPSSAAAGLRVLREWEGDIESFHFYTLDVLEDELATRVADEPMIMEVSHSSPRRRVILAGVDGSTRGGLLSLEGEHGELVVGHAPMVSINTAVAQLSGHATEGGKNRPAFLRFPEKPEDMQQRDNRYTVMARLFFPDLTESEFAHSLWNAMDLLESRATQRVMSRWYLPGTSTEIAPADVVFRDGAASPNDRDFTHYHTESAYGKIVRDLIEASWEIARKCRDDAQTVVGVIKTAHLRILAPVINWRLKELAKNRQSPLLERWPLRQFNLVDDQTLMTRILTVGIEKGAPWLRSALILRPFHATTNYAPGYTREDPPPQQILRRWHDELATAEPENRSFWEDYFNGDRDPYVQMLNNVNYASVFVGAVPRLDSHKSVPRFEIVVPAATREQSPERLVAAGRHLENAMVALHATGFNVAKEHAMYNHPATLDVLPNIIIRVHETVKDWAGELLARVSEFIGYKLREHRISSSNRAIRLRKMTRMEFETWVHQMQSERERTAGSGGSNGTSSTIGAGGAGPSATT
jgi:hypothetical protein